MERSQKENMGKFSTVQVFTQEEAEQAYQELLSKIDNVDEFKEAGRKYELDLEQRALYEDLIDYEFLLGLDNKTDC